MPATQAHRVPEKSRGWDRDQTECWYRGPETSNRAGRPTIATTRARIHLMCVEARRRGGAEARRRDKKGFVRLGRSPAYISAFLHQFFSVLLHRTSWFLSRVLHGS